MSLRHNMEEQLSIINAFVNYMYMYVHSVTGIVLCLMLLE